MECIDLTNADDENPRQPKAARVNQSSSQARSSQPLPNQTLSQISQAAHDTWADEGNEVLVLSQDVDEGFGWTCLGAIDGKIVGIRYYAGMATPGEQVMICREPRNQYDSNAIRINNVHGDQIGHIPRNLAAKLAPYLVSISPSFMLLD